MPISETNDNVSENFISHKDEKSLLEEQDIKGDHRNCEAKVYILKAM